MWGRGGILLRGKHNSRLAELAWECDSLHRKTRKDRANSSFALPSGPSSRPMVGTKRCRADTIMTPNLPRPRTTVIYKDLPEGAILFCTRTEVYFSLNPIGAKIWKLLPPVCVREDQVVAHLSAEYPDINLGKISADVRRLLDELVGNGLADLPRAA